MTDEEIRALIVARLQNCNRWSDHQSGQVRALVSVLLGGTAPPSSGVLGYLNLAKIPYQLIGENRTTVDFDSGWLKKHGFSIIGGEVRHPIYSEPWP